MAGDKTGSLSELILSILIRQKIKTRESSKLLFHFRIWQENHFKNFFSIFWVIGLGWIELG